MRIGLASAKYLAMPDGLAVRFAPPRTTNDARGLHRPRWAVRTMLAAAAISLAGGLCTTARAAVPQGVWIIEESAAVEIYECGGLMCGRILWLLKPRDAQGRLDRDMHNPDPALRSRPLCGLTMLWGLHPQSADRWNGGWFYNPHDGVTYRVSARLTSPDLLTTRIYVGLPLFGQTKTLRRVLRGTSEGWC